MFEVITQTQPTIIIRVEILKEAYQKSGARTIRSRPLEWRLAEAYFNVGSYTLRCRSAKSFC